MNSLISIKNVPLTIWAIVWFFIIAAGLELVVSYGLIWRFPDLEKYLLRKNNDHWTHSAFEIEKIQNHRENDQDKLLVFIGGSVSLEAISQDRIISKKINRLTGMTIGFKSICTSYQTFSDNAKIVEALGDFGGIILIGIEPANFKSWPERQLVQRLKSGHLHKKYYYLSGPGSINDILEKNGMKVGVYHRINLIRTAQVFGEIVNKQVRYLIKHRGKWKRVLHKRHAAGDGKPVRVRRIKTGIDSFCQRLLCWYNTYHKLNLELLKETIRIAHANGNKVILVDMPNSPVFEKIISKFSPHYDIMIRKVVKKLGVGYIDMRQAAEWDLQDFKDFHHLRRPGRQKLTRALAVSLAKHPSLMEP